VRVSEEASEERESGESARADREHAWGENPRTHLCVSYLFEDEIIIIVIAVAECAA
tara:strand:+ start:141 stop:308 length:168 start_codon:yes stop_codon:yes gene_type:complete